MRALSCSAFVTVAILGLLAHFALTAPKPPPPLRLIVSPHIALAPSDVTVQVRLVPDPQDRFIDVALDSGEFRRSSEWSIEGADAPKLYRVWWHAVPDGEYEVRAQVGDRAGIRATAVDRITIVAPGVTDR